MKKLNKILISLASVVSISSLPMIAASCGAKKKDVETSNSKNQDSKTNSKSNSENQDPKTNSKSNSENQDPKTNSKSNSGNKDSKPNPESNSENQDPKTNSKSNSENQDPKTNSKSNSGNKDSKPNPESNSGKQDSKPNPESNSENQDSKTDGSSNKSTRPSESTPNDMPAENSELDYLDKVKEYGKEASELTTLSNGTEEAIKLLKKYTEIEPIVRKILDLYDFLEPHFGKTKEQIEEFLGDHPSKNELLDIPKQYEESREKIKTAIKELKELKK